MARWLPLVYGAVLALEALALTVVYAVWMPEASDPIGLWLGIAGLLSMVVMLGYSIARRSRTLRQMARLSTWLHVHIFLGVQGVLFAFFHSLPWLGRVATGHLTNPGVVNLAAVTVVFFSGLFGRYLYAQVPKTIGGQHLERVELDAEIANLETEIPKEISRLWRRSPTASTLLGVMRADLARREAMAKVRRANLPPDTERIALRRLQLERQRAVLDVAQRWFRGWIFLHRPIAASMYLLTLVHILLSVMFTPHLRLF